MRLRYFLRALTLTVVSGAAQARKYYFCSANVRDGNRVIEVMGGVAVLRDGYREGETVRLQDDFEKRVMTRYPWVRYVTCYNHAASDASTREVMRKSMASYRERGAQVAEIEFNVDYTGGIPDGRPSRAPGVYVTLPTPAPQPVPQTSSAPAQPAPATAESEIRRREAAADAELARYLYSKQQAEEARRAAERQQSEARYAQQVAAHADQVARQRQRAAKVQA